MALRYIGTDTTCPNTSCPTVWVDEADGSLVIQGYKLDAETMGEVNATAPVQENETVVRIPARMASVLRGAMREG
ncbi:hypothetical protein EV644_14212 [Kribbella orskensis]|uniref:Uncharacterized protein n=1 Tax=Kribbella orskensis TaxID=2512216 RepID=A0ABY2B6G4_9ACTN|nr:hypothetical protein EV642_14512 [Kribbella sp. VKM Ac-2500]TCO08980.1 hypothetical protein EV644_14212 [Kribbella orskensis]